MSVLFSFQFLLKASFLNHISFYKFLIPLQLFSILPLYFLHFAPTGPQQRVWRSVSCSPCPLPLQELQKEEDPRRVFEELTDTPLWVVNWQMLKPHNSIYAGGASFSSAFVPQPLVFLAAMNQTLVSTE